MLARLSEFFRYYFCFRNLSSSNFQPEDSNEENYSHKLRAEANFIITKMLQNLAEKQAQIESSPLIDLNLTASSFVNSLIDKIKLEFKQKQVNFKMYIY